MARFWGTIVVFEPSADKIKRIREKYGLTFRGMPNDTNLVVVSWDVGHQRRIWTFQNYGTGFTISIGEELETVPDP